MKTLGTMAVLLVVLGLCLPSYAEILVYKSTQNATTYLQDGGEWHVETVVRKGYLVVEVDYDAGTITQGAGIGYGRDADGKWYEQNTVNFELVRVESGTSVRWVVMEKDVEFDGQEITGGIFSMVTGLARDRSIGTAEKQEVANKLSGYGLYDEAGDGQRYITESTLSATLYPAWTYWANGDGENEGNQDFDTTTQMIVDYLTNRGYVEQP
jgi:hypothetical protein